MNLIERIEKAYIKKQIPPFRPGDIIRIFSKVKEGDKERLQAFEGVVLRKRGGGLRSTLMVRKISYGVGVERIFPLYSPVIDRIEVVQRSKSRRARLYYLRKLAGRKARMEAEEFFGESGESSGGKESPSKEKSSEPPREAASSL